MYWFSKIRGLKVFTDRDFLRKEFSKYVWVSPDNYWAYGSFAFSFINEREQTVAYKKTFSEMNRKYS
jgi:hypothetical protein